MLALLPGDELRRLYPDEDLGGLTDHSLRTRSGLETELGRIARRGYAVSHEESERGVGSVAVAFPSRQNPMRLAINVAAPISRMGRADTGRIATAVRAAVAEAAALLH